jgi:predicted nucleic-acid-binding protein
MKITADTNLLVRAVLNDHPAQSTLAAAALREAKVVALPLPVLCEFVWVLSRGYKIPTADIVHAVQSLIDSASSAVDRQAAEAGLALLASGGDFADGVIASEGFRLGGEELLSFDRKAVLLLKRHGHPARLLS